MAQSLRCECADDDEYRTYQPMYVEAYFNNRECEQQTIDDWTESEGLQFFAAGEIYRPVDLPVAITGSEPNAFEVDMTRPGWRANLQAAVKTAAIAAGLAKASDKVELQNMRNEPLGEEVDRFELEQVGMVYATVNGQRTVDMVKSKQAGLGCATRTPLGHSPIKGYVLNSFVADLVVRAKELVISSLVPSTSMYDLNDRVMGADKAALDLKTQVADLVMRDAGLCTAELGTFMELLNTYSDPLALKAIERGKLSERGVAEKIATHIVNEVVEQLRADNKEVEAFYQAQQLTKGGNGGGGGGALLKNQIGSIFSTESTVGQTSARLNKILAAYPTSAKLYRTVVSIALDSNESLCASILGTVRNAIPPNQRQRWADHFESVGNHHGGDHAEEYGYDHGHHAGNHRHTHHKTEHDARGHHKGSHSEKHGGHRSMQHHDDPMDDDEEPYGYRSHPRVPAYKSRYVKEAYPRHEAHLTPDQATQAQIRSYVAAGLVPPRFTLFEAETGTIAAKKERLPTAMPTSARVAASKSTPNVTREAASLEPGSGPARVTSVSRITPVKNTFPVAAAAVGLSTPKVAFSQSPPPLETAKAAAVPVGRSLSQRPAFGLASSELPSTEPEPQARATMASLAAVGARTRLGWTNEMPSAEPVSAKVPAQVGSTKSPTTKSKPPPLEYTAAKKTSPSTMPTATAPKQSQAAPALPSLAQMLKQAESGRVH